MRQELSEVHADDDDAPRPVDLTREADHLGRTDPGSMQNIFPRRIQLGVR